MPIDRQDVLFTSALGFCLGILHFFKGFWVYRKYRVLADTPVMPLRSIAMGLIEIDGRAEGNAVVNAPLTNTRCFFYKVDIEVWKDDDDEDTGLGGRSGGEGSPNLFDIVFTHAAELDLIETGQREQQNSGGEFLTTVLFYRGIRPTDTVLKNYAGVRGVSVDSSTRLRFTESCILPGQSLHVTGTCVENPHAKDLHDRNLVVKGENEPEFLISRLSEREVEKSLRNEAVKFIFGGGAVAILCLGVFLGMVGWF